MKKFGFGKKGDDDDSSNRSALFGSRGKRDKSPNPAAASNNPYANLPTQADAYNAAKSRAGVPGYAQQSTGKGGAQGLDDGRYGGGRDGRGGGGLESGPYGGESRGGGGYEKGGGEYPNEKKQQGYGANPYGAQGGYGGDRYGTSESASSGGMQQQKSSRYGTGGYGGLGPAPSSTADDSSRDALFGGARDRVQAKQNTQMGYGAPPPYEEGDPRYQQPDEQSQEPSYQPYGDRQLTAEEEEEEDVTATKQQIKFIKQSDVSSTRNALRIAAQAEETGMNTLARIGAQGERIHNTEKNLDLTSNHNRSAEDKAKELKKLNRSMFAVHVSNPFTASKRAEQADLDVLERHHLEREQREQTRRQMYQTDQRMQKTFQDISEKGQGSKAAANNNNNKQSSLAERAKYQFEADSEDDEMENEIDSNLNALGGAASRLNGLARATGKEVDEQNRHLERINAKSTKVDDEVCTWTALFLFSLPSSSWVLLEGYVVIFLLFL